MKKYFVFALIAVIIMSNCFSAAAFAEEMGSPSDVKLIYAEAPDAETEEAEVPDAEIEDETPDAAADEVTEEAEAPDAIVEETESSEAVIEEAEAPDAESEAVFASEEIADSEELTGEGGNCGPNATWEISGSMLKISGEGAMYDYNTMASPWYEQRSTIKTVFVGDGITEIGTNAFFELVSLVGVSLPSSLKRIERMAFYRCRNLPVIEIPSGVTYIGEQAFGVCPKLGFVTFLGGSPQIQSNAFANVTADVFYPAANSSWSPNTKLQYGGTLNWRSVTSYYEVWVAGIRVNSANRSDILKDGSNVRYVPSSKILYMNSATMPEGCTVSRDFYNYTTAIYAIGGLTLQGNFNDSDMDVYVDGELSLIDGDFRIYWIYANGLTVRNTRLELESIAGGSIDLEGSYLYAHSISAYDHIGIKDSEAFITSSNDYYGVYTGVLEIQDSDVRVERPNGTAISCLTEFKIRNSTLTANGQYAGISSPRIKILKGNTISAKGDEGAVYGVEDVMSAPIEIAPGYVFLAPANPVIGTYGIMENGKYASYVSMKPLESLDKGGLRRGKTAVTNITLPTLSTAQLEPRTKDGYYITGGTWSSGNSGIASVDKNGLVKANKYGKTKITCKIGSVTLTCDVQTRFYDVNDPNQAGYKQIYWGVDKGIIAGFNGVYFGPDKSCTRLQFAVMMWRAKGKPKASGLLTFKDTKNLDPNTDSYKAILWASKNGIVKGYSDGTFRPNSNITRESIVIILWRMAGQPRAKKALAFKDTKKLSTTSTAYKAISWASQTGIVKGYTDNTFRKDDYCKRFQCIILIYRYVNR